MDLPGIIQQHHKELGELDKEIIGYVLKNQAEIEKMSIIDLANAAHASKSTILRLTKKIGFTGFSEFKYFLKQDLAAASYTGPDIDSIEAQLNDIKRTIDYLRS